MANHPAMPLGMVKVMIIANAPSNIKYQGPRSARNPRNKKNTIVPIGGPSIRPMPPITTMKTIHAVQCPDKDCGSQNKKPRVFKVLGSSTAQINTCSRAIRSTLPNLQREYYL